jgi:hypothetical protein
MTIKRRIYRVGLCLYCGNTTRLQFPERKCMKCFKKGVTKIKEVKYIEHNHRCSFCINLVKQNSFEFKCEKLGIYMAEEETFYKTQCQHFIKH